MYWPVDKVVALPYTARTQARGMLLQQGTYWKYVKNRVCCAFSLYLYYAVLICTPCWAGVWSGELTLLENITQTESKYLRQRAFKDIGTVRNVMKWVVVCFVCFKVWVKYITNQEGGKMYGPMYDVYQ